VNKLAAVIITVAAITFSTNNLADDKDALEYFDSFRSFEVVLITPTLEAGSKNISADGNRMVKRKSLAGSNKDTLAAHYTKPLR
jgi:hypothetical protein